MRKRIVKIILLSLMVSFAVPIYAKENNENVCDNNVIIQKEIRSSLSDKTEMEELNHNVNIAAAEMNQKMNNIKHTKDTKDWFVSYKNIVDEYSYILDPPETIYDYFTEEELDLLFRVVQAEAGDECSFEQKTNVASIIFNRIKHERFDDDMLSVLSKDQFHTISNGRYKKVAVSAETILACEYSFMFGDTTNGCLFFDSNGRLNYEFVKNDGAHNLYRLMNGG